MTRRERRALRSHWKATRAAALRRAAELETATSVVVANRALTQAIAEWEQSSLNLARTHEDAGFFGQVAQRRRMSIDRRAREAITLAIQSRKASVPRKVVMSKDLGPHDWLKDAWR